MPTHSAMDAANLKPLNTLSKLITATEMIPSNQHPLFLIFNVRHGTVIQAHEKCINVKFVSKLASWRGFTVARTAL